MVILGVKVTRHAEQRERKRCGVPKKATKRLAQIAFENGLKHSETTGNLHKYLTSLYFKNKKANNLRVYGDKVYVFSDEVLVTVLNLPRGCMEIAKKCFERKRRESG